MRKLFFIPFLFLPLTTMAACSSDDTPAPQTEQSTTPDDTDNPSGNSKTLVAYFSAQGHTHSDRIQNEAYNDLRPGVANLPDKEIIAQYDTIFVGSPCWWHQPAMVVCTFLEAYDLKDKVVIPFFTYGATTYLNESMQKIYKVTPESKHLPETLPEDLNPDDITTPGPPDDAGIDMPGSANGTEAWLRRIGIIK